MRQLLLLVELPDPEDPAEVAAFVHDAVVTGDNPFGILSIDLPDDDTSQATLDAENEEGAES